MGRNFGRNWIGIWQSELLSERNVFTTGSSRDKYVCPRTLTSHPRPTRSTAVIAATDKNSFLQHKRRKWMPYRQFRSGCPVPSPFFSPRFESSLKQLKLGYIPYILFFAVASMSLLIFVLFFNCATSDKLFMLAGWAMYV